MSRTYFFLIQDFFSCFIFIISSHDIPGVPVDPSQVILSHSPLRVLDILHDKHVLVSGQGPVSEIAEMCGFSRVCHVDDIDCHFPELDVNDKLVHDSSCR